MVPECILKLMDFSEEESDLAQSEFNGKYVGSIVLINDKSYELVHNLTSSYLETSNTYYANEKVHSIKAVHPKVGLYTIGENLIYVYKLQKRQYTKSFCLDQTHKMVLLDSGPIPYKTEDLFSHGKYHGETAEHKGYLWIRWKPVAEISHELKKIVVTNNAFTPEIEELWNRQLRYSLEFRRPNPNMKQAAMEEPKLEAIRKVKLPGLGPLPPEQGNLGMWMNDPVVEKLLKPNPLQFL